MDVRRRAAALVVVLAVGAAPGCEHSDRARADRTTARPAPTAPPRPSMPRPSRPPAPTPPASPAPAPPSSNGTGETALERWASGLCGAFRGWTAAVSTVAADGRARALAAADRAGRKTELLATYDETGRRTDALLADLRVLPAPDGPGGAPLQADVLDRFARFRRQLDTLRRRTDDADPADPAGFDRAVGAAGEAFSSEVEGIARAFAELDDRYPDPAWQRAISSRCAG